jgi:hypothetical protein
VYGDKTLKRTQIYKIMKKVKEGTLAMGPEVLHTKRCIRNSAFTTEVENDRHNIVRKLARAHGMLTKTIST